MYANKREIRVNQSGALYKAKSTWDGIIEKNESRLAGWKRLYLSRGVD